MTTAELAASATATEQVNFERVYIGGGYQDFGSAADTTSSTAGTTTNEFLGY